MAVSWSREASTYVWDCAWGCRGTDHESAWEAEQSFLQHKCFGYTAGAVR